MLYIVFLGFSNKLNKKYVCGLGKLVGNYPKSIMKTAADVSMPNLWAYRIILTSL